MNVKHVTCLAAALTLLSGCAVNNPEPWDYAAFQKSAPRSILVMMPTSQASDVKAGPACLASSVQPLAEAGYYPMPVTMVYDTMRFNGVTEAGEMHQLPLPKLKEVFGADAVMYIDVEEYDTTYKVLDSVSKVKVNARLVDINTGADLWTNRFTVNNADSSPSSNPIAQLIGAVVKHVVNEAADVKFPLSQTNAWYLYTPGAIRPTPILAGPYHPQYGNDAILKKIEADRRAGAAEDPSGKKSE